MEPFREHYHGGPVFEQLLYVSRLYTRHMGSASLVPVPLSSLRANCYGTERL
jgi:hypothetical protein